jgi:hypothetical protein
MRGDLYISCAVKTGLLPACYFTYCAQQYLIISPYSGYSPQQKFINSCFDLAALVYFVSLEDRSHSLHPKDWTVLCSRFNNTVVLCAVRLPV